VRKKQAIKLLKEFYPYIQTEASQAVQLGPPPEIHANSCQNDCPDCLWYNWGLSFQQRIKNGEFNEIIN